MARPKDPNKLHFRQVGLTAAQWEWLQGWCGDNDTQRLQTLLRYAMDFWPQAEAFEWPRDKRGRFARRVTGQPVAVAGESQGDSGAGR